MWLVSNVRVPVPPIRIVVAATLLIAAICLIPYAYLSSHDVPHLRKVAGVFRIWPTLRSVGGDIDGEDDMDSDWEPSPAGNYTHSST